MNNYTDRDGNPWTMNQTRSRLSQDLYADLVAAIEIGRAYQAKCERLEESLRQIGYESDVIGDSPDAGLYIDCLQTIYAMAHKALT